jgi:hypothetical protein
MTAAPGGLGVSALCVVIAAYLYFEWKDRRK